MTMEIEVEAREGYLRVLVTGRYQEPRQSGELFAKIVASCRSLGVQDVLIDSCQVLGEAYATDKSLILIAMGEHHQRHMDAGGARLRVAILSSPNFISQTTREMSQALADAHGFELFGSTDAQAVHDWLGVPMEPDGVRAASDAVPVSRQ